MFKRPAMSGSFFGRWVLPVDIHVPNLSMSSGTAVSGNTEASEGYNIEQMRACASVIIGVPCANVAL